jgi:hypothetical protein
LPTDDLAYDVQVYRQERLALRRSQLLKSTLPSGTSLVSASDSAFAASATEVPQLPPVVVQSSTAAPRIVSKFGAMATPIASPIPGGSVANVRTTDSGPDAAVDATVPSPQAQSTIGPSGQSGAPSFVYYEYTVTVGKKPSAAQYFLDDTQQVEDALKALALASTRLHSATQQPAPHRALQSVSDASSQAGRTPTQPSALPSLLQQSMPADLNFLLQRYRPSETIETTVPPVPFDKRFMSFVTLPIRVSSSTDSAAAGLTFHTNVTQLQDTRETHSSMINLAAHARLVQPNQRARKPSVGEPAVARLASVQEGNSSALSNLFASTSQLQGLAAQQQQQTQRLGSFQALPTVIEATPHSSPLHDEHAGTMETEDEVCDNTQLYEGDGDDDSDSAFCGAVGGPDSHGGTNEAVRSGRTVGVHDNQAAGSGSGSVGRYSSSVNMTHAVHEPEEEDGLSF